MERKGDFISTNIRHKTETEVVTFQGKEITRENLSPVFSQPNAGNWSSSFMRCSANMPISGRKRSRGVRFPEAIVNLRGCWRYNRTVSSSVSFLRNGATT